jgi:hypothetical protein
MLKKTDILKLRGQMSVDGEISHPESIWRDECCGAVQGNDSCARPAARPMPNQSAFEVSAPRRHRRATCRKVCQIFTKLHLSVRGRYLARRAAAARV